MDFKALFLAEQGLLTDADDRLAHELSPQALDQVVSTFGLTNPIEHGDKKPDLDKANRDSHQKDDGAPLPSGIEALEIHRTIKVNAERRIAKRQGNASTAFDKLRDDVQSDRTAYRGAIGEDGNQSDFVELRTNATNGEPFVSFVGMDRTGLALSGGGIRSATFNLGLLQGLNHHNLLDLVDYLSTVSGGGYIGGWWSAWKHRVGRYAGLEFPSISSDRQQQTQVELPPEPHEVRHLREFSNFLVPRLGVFNMDMWYGVVAILSGMIPTLIMGGCLLGLTCVFWLLCFLGFSGFAALPEPQSLGALRVGLCSAAVMAILTAIVVFGYELLWRRSAGIRNGRVDFAESTFNGFAACAIAVTAMVMLLLATPAIQLRIANLLRPYVLEWLLGEIQFSVVNPVIAWWFASLAVLLARFVAFWRHPAASTPPVIAASSRVLGRLLGLTLAWILLSAAWEAGRALVWIIQNSPWVAAGYGSVGAAAAETFRRIRSWMNAQPTKAQTGFLRDRIKPLLPQILAYFVVAASYVVVAASVGELLERPFWLGVTTILGIGALAALCRFVNPEALGLHWFYRERILRTYAGASNTALSGQPHTAPTAAENRRTDVDEHDELTMADLVKNESEFIRPLHLFCCTANDLFGDHLGNLYRGARSAVLSPHGVAIGDVSTSAPELSLSNAQTASAAAFNSQMGSVSRKLGPAVSFLMAALNLRLGTWVRIPAESRDRPWRGLLLLKEFWSGTTCPVPLVPPCDVHLSDGGHFENLGLYELVRRHCRFIVVSDCAADPEYKFDDLGTALRRIRTDFGVEIDIDVSPLVPGPNGRAAQHMAVGTIYYDKASDLGILLFFKPNLLGEEPDDIQQYRRRNTAFPQEPTGDQFYDEAQWESYRKLGEHAARSAFRFLERTPSPDRPSRYFVFAEAAAQWSPSSASLDTNFLEQTERLSSLVAGFRATNATTMIDELLPELGTLNEPPEERLALPQLMQLMQLMEDAFVSLRLDRTFTNPRLSGWDNLFRRSTESALFRKWWPALQPLYCRPFRQFINEEYGLKSVSPGSSDSAQHRTVAELTDDIRNQDKVWKAVIDRYPQQAQSPKKTVLFRFTLAELTYLYMALLHYERDNDVVRWAADDLFVLPPLRRINVQGTFLWDVLTFFSGFGVKTIEVNVDPNPANALRTDAAYRAFQADRMRLYMALGFKLRRRDGHQFVTKELL